MGAGPIESLGELSSVIVAGNFTAYNFWGHSLIYCKGWCCSSLETTNTSVTATVPFQNIVCNHFVSNGRFRGELSK